ncbi:rhodopsin-like isoform X1 [Hydractinia symbiolongicarpus]|uniref:rhodopsin-like isoform X1 n=1 Tax=Hydractinia symbiolongicarpus TaxID=13093 RepID=UPI00254E829F|nr:rhodopsin-like isoform X1 [Hydractinia symbiolongicarpus]XP_057313403.1 rhodopsin-like isoform X1 [Hydractinia symbiolongicarpus]
MGHRERVIPSQVQIGLYCFIGSISLLSNILIITVIVSKKSMRTRSNIFLVNLALTDLFIILFGLPPTITNLALGYHGTNNVYCNITGSLILIMFLCSNFNLTLIAMHRYILISRNKYYRRIFSKKNSIISACISWSIAVTMSLPPFFGWGKYTYNFGRAHCMVEWGYSLSYLLFIQILAFPVPVTILIFCYYKVVKSTNDSRKRLTASADRHNLSKKLREWKLTMMLLAVVVSLLFCFMPYAALIYLEGVFKTETTEIHSFLAMIFAYSNSIFDFWIYSIMSSKFRNTLYSIFNKLFAKRNRVFPSVESDTPPDEEMESDTPTLSERRRSFMLRTQNGNSKNPSIRAFYETDGECKKHGTSSYLDSNKMTTNLLTVTSAQNATG